MDQQRLPAPTPPQICWCSTPQEQRNCTNDLGKVREIITTLLFSGLALTFKVCRLLNILITGWTCWNWSHHVIIWRDLRDPREPADGWDTPNRTFSGQQLWPITTEPPKAAYRTGKRLIKGYEINYFLEHKSNGMSSVVLVCFFFQKCSIMY